MKYKSILIASSVAMLLLSGCSQSDGTSDAEDNIAGYAVFNPTTGSIPYPNNVLFAPNSSSTNDYDQGHTLNIPYEPEDADAAIKKQLNALSGFSTISPIIAPVTTGIDSTTFAKGVTVYKAEIDTSTGAVKSIQEALTQNLQYVVAQDESNSSIIIIPTQPLASNSTYVVMFTDALKDKSSRPLASDTATALTLSTKSIEAGSALSEESAAALEQLRQANQATMAAISKFDQEVKTDNIVQLWSFRTQLIDVVQKSLALYASTSVTPNLNLNDGGMTTKTLLASKNYDVSTMADIAETYFGTLSNLPQFMPDANATNYKPAIEGQFSFNNSFLPTLEHNATIPAVATVPVNNPACVMPAAGWPVIIYQHGITRNRTDLFVFGETFASKCFASVAIDLPLHGLTDTNTTTNPFAMYERTFNLDIVTQDADEKVIAQGPDGVVDSSGTHYVNFAHIATTRDNMRQTTSDLLQLEKALGAVTSQNSSLKFDTSKIHLYAHSLGTIAAAGYLAHSTNLNTITLAMPGQGVAQLLNNSGSFGYIIKEGLASKGIIAGTAEYESFMIASQTIVDAADPANYAQMIATEQTAPILAFEVIGSSLPTVPCSGVAADSDNAIPNCVATAPLSGTEPFLQGIGAKDINMTDGSAGIKPVNGNTVTRLTQGAHASPLLPDIATKEIHTQTISFIASNGAGLLVDNPSIIHQP